MQYHVLYLTMVIKNGPHKNFSLTLSLQVILAVEVFEFFSQPLFPQNHLYRAFLHPSQIGCNLQTAFSLRAHIFR